MRLIPRSRPALVSVGVCLLAAVLIAAWVAVDLAWTGRARPPSAQRDAAVAAFEEAIRGPSVRWAPDALGAADGALRSALFEWSRQQARLFPFRDFRPATAALLRAEAFSREAVRLGRIALAEGRGLAEQSVREALLVEAQARALVAVTALPDAQRLHLQRARLLVREAEALLRDGEISETRERADRSRSELREALGPALEVAARYTSPEQVATWLRWIDETRAWSGATGGSAIVVLKEKNVLILLSNGAPVRTYGAEVGANALGVKQHQGDRATPEGRYRIVAKKDRGLSHYHRALPLDYPNADDRKRFAAAQRRGELPQAARIGGFIEIHGGGGRGQNWTDGCVALSNGDIDDLYPRVDVGTPVTIVGGDGREGVFSDLLARIGKNPEHEKP